MKSSNQIIKALFTILLFIIKSHLLIAQDNVANKDQSSDYPMKIIHKNGHRYVQQGTDCFLLDTTTITVKAKEVDLPLYVKKQEIVTNKLGYTDLKVPEEMDIEEFAEHLRKSELFESVEYNSYGSYHIIWTNDSYRINQWYLDRVSIPKAWTFSMGNNNVKVAILDSGINYMHEDLGVGVDNYTNIDFENGDILPLEEIGTHGTKVAGIIAAKNNNNRGISGIGGGNMSNGVCIIPYFIGKLSPSSNLVANRIVSAVDAGAKIIQMSFSVSNTSAIRSSLSYAYSHNVAIICSSGNENSSVSFPASSTYTFAVGATNGQNARAEFSNYGNHLDVVAPGTYIYTSNVAGGYEYTDGTSFSAPIVSGVVALMLSKNINLTVTQIYNTLRTSAKKINGYTFDENGWNNQVGYGMVDAYSAIRAVASMRIIGDNLICESSTYNVEGLPEGAHVEWSIDNNYYQDSENLFIEGYPETNSCTIIRNEIIPLNGWLTAQVFDSDFLLIKSLTKHVKAREKAEFPFTYQSGAIELTRIISEDEAVQVRSNDTLKIVDSRFHNMTVESANTDIMHDGDTLLIKTPTVSAIINATSNIDCDHFSFEIYTRRRPIIDPIFPPIELSNSGTITVSLPQKDAEQIDSNSTYNADETSWQLAIYRCQDGQRMYNRVLTQSENKISTNGWNKGIYVCRLSVSGKTFIKKIKL